MTLAPPIPVLADPVHGAVVDRAVRIELMARSLEQMAVHAAAQEHAGTAQQRRRALREAVAVLERAAQAKDKETAAQKRKRRRAVLSALALLLFAAGINFRRAKRLGLESLLSQPRGEGVVSRPHPALSTELLKTWAAKLAALERGRGKAVGIIERGLNRMVRDTRKAVGRGVKGVKLTTANREAMRRSLTKAARDAIGLTGLFPREPAGLERLIGQRMKLLEDFVRELPVKIAGGGPTEFELERVIETEATAIAGWLNLQVLRADGYDRKSWVTVGDDRVRDSHVACEAEGAIPIDARFSNGLLYPGDPDGSADETCNCRCWLVGEPEEAER